jgi:hypothetical protein
MAVSPHVISAVRSPSATICPELRRFRMRVMIRLSLLLNIFVLTPICVGLITDASWIGEAYGPLTAARGILLSVYFSIGLVSVLLLLAPEPRAVGALLLVQVVYKLTTPVTVGTFFNPVVVSNLGIAAFHTVTIVIIFLARQRWASHVRGPVAEDDGLANRSAT